MTLKHPHMFNLPRCPHPFFLSRLSEVKRFVHLVRFNESGILPPITGPVGSGKRSLVLQFIQEYQHHYDFIFWLSGTVHQIHATYRHIAATLNIKVQDLNLRQLTQEIETHLSNYRCLYIFSTTPSFTALHPYFPKLSHILITSPNSIRTAWPRNPFHIAALSEKEKFEFIRHYSKNTPYPLDDFKPFLPLIPSYPLAIMYTFKYLNQKSSTLDKLIDTIKAKPILFRTLIRDAENRNHYYQFIRHVADLLPLTPSPT